ncbi:MAG: restriction endonuclease [Parvibaculum sp.]
MNWQQFELEVAQALALEYSHATIQKNILKPGLLSRTNRQCDITIEETVDGKIEETIVEVKQRARQIDVKEIDAFSGMLRDIGVNRGILITSKGFSKAAINRAHFGYQDIQLDILCFEDFNSFQGFCGIPYANNNGILIRAPLGWVVDAQKTPFALAWLYQRGLTLDQAQQRKEFMYVNFWKTRKKGFIDQLIKRQNVRMINVYGDVPITVDNLEVHPQHQIRLRTAHLAENLTEISGFVEFEKFIFFCVAFCSPVSVKRITKKVENLLRAAVPLSMKYSRPT